MASTPSTVAGTSAGAATRFAGTAYVAIDGSSRTRTGAHASWAVSGTASANAGPLPIHGARRRDTGWVPSTRAAVATLDSTNPYERASHGSSSSSTTTTAASAGTAREGRPSPIPTSPTTPMAAARSTLGSGWTSSTNPAMTAPVTPMRTPRGARASAHSAVTVATTIAKWPPETAVTCVRPVVLRAASSSSSMREVSPTATPGSSARASAGRPSEAVSRSARSTPTTPSAREGGAVTTGGPLATRVATVRSPGPAGRSRPDARTSAP
ncbi:hypothetical protein D3C74_340880 [compost metagenome]